jgi:hypothetical protein
MVLLFRECGQRGTKGQRRMMSSGLLRRVALVRTQKTPFFIVTAVKTSNLIKDRDLESKMTND